MTTVRRKTHHIDPIENHHPSEPTTRPLLGSINGFHLELITLPHRLQPIAKNIPAEPIEEMLHIAGETWKAIFT